MNGFTVSISFNNGLFYINHDISILAGTCICTSSENKRYETTGKTSTILRFYLTKAILKIVPVTGYFSLYFINWPFYDITVLLCFNIVYGCTALHVSNDQPLKTFLIPPIADNKHVPSSDGEIFPPWVKFRENHNFHVSFIVFDVQITVPKDCVHHCWHHTDESLNG